MIFLRDLSTGIKSRDPVRNQKPSHRKETGMETKEIKKALQAMIKQNGWNKCYGTYGIHLSAVQKQMEKGNATIGFGYTDDDSYDAEATYERFINSPEFKDTMKAINGTWVREEKADHGWQILYIRIYF